jgi:hypothetical protein
MYNSIGSSISVVNSSLLDGENISFDASPVTYINSTNIQPILIMNRMYENQNLLYIVPLITHNIVVSISNIIPMAIACFIGVNINLVIVLNDIRSFVISVFALQPFKRVESHLPFSGIIRRSPYTPR